MYDDNDSNVHTCVTCPHRGFGAEGHEGGPVPCRFHPPSKKAPSYPRSDGAGCGQHPFSRAAVAVLERNLISDGMEATGVAKAMAAHAKAQDERAAERKRRSGAKGRRG